MLSETFLTRLRDAFPGYYEEVNAQAMEDAARLRREARGDLERALVRARVEGAARLWWPYVKGTMPLVGDRRPAMREFSRLVLTVDHLVGYQPAGMEDARRQVVEVLRNSVDVERLKRLVETREAEKAAAGAGIAASLTALLSPVTMLRSARRWYKLMPPPLRATMGAVLVAALLSVPFVAGFSAGHEAEKAARNYGELPDGHEEAPRERKRATA